MSVLSPIYSKVWFEGKSYSNPSEAGLGLTNAWMEDCLVDYAIPCITRRKHTHTHTVDINKIMLFYRSIYIAVIESEGILKEKNLF